MTDNTELMNIADRSITEKYLRLQEVMEIIKYDIKEFVKEIDRLCQFYNDKRNINDYNQGQRDMLNSISGSAVLEDIKRHSKKALIIDIALSNNERVECLQDMIECEEFQALKKMGEGEDNAMDK